MASGGHGPERARHAGSLTMRIPAAIALGVTGMAFGAWQYMDAQYFRITSAVALEQRLELAQAQTAADIKRDIEQIRLQNVIAELEAIQARQDAGRPLPGDVTRRRQLVAQMNAIIQKLEAP